jgi:Ser/Thr protein kinase RdoA (MazF antagonist)
MMLSMAEASSPVIVAASLFGLDAAQLRPLGGNSASAWDAGGQVLRLGQRSRMEIEAAAAAAAAAVVPVPKILDRADFGGMTAVLLERLPGHDAGSLASRSPALARAVGRACGAVAARLATLPAPARLPPVRAAGSCAQQLVHLDLHPFNILVSDGAEITGVLDWANARVGDPVADRARSWAILNLDPAARARRALPGWRALTQGWTESGALDAVPAAARAWACRFMLTDLAGRYPAADLAHVRRALRQAEANARQQNSD